MFLLPKLQRLIEWILVLDLDQTPVFLQVVVLRMLAVGHAHAGGGKGVVRAHAHRLAVPGWSACAVTADCAAASTTATAHDALRLGAHGSFLHHCHHLLRALMKRHLLIGRQRRIWNGKRGVSVREISSTFARDEVGSQR